jgi:hypothetical protein
MKKKSGFVQSRSLYGPRDSPPFEPESVVRALFTTFGPLGYGVFTP